MTELICRLLAVGICCTLAAGCKKVQSPADVLPKLEQIESIKADISIPTMANFPSFEVPKSYFPRLMDPLLKAELSPDGYPGEPAGHLEIKTKAGAVTKIELYAPYEQLTEYGVEAKNRTPYVFKKLPGMELGLIIISAWNELNPPP